VTWIGCKASGGGYKEEAVRKEEAKKGRTFRGNNSN
jgi:hypothetical protein